MKTEKYASKTTGSLFMNLLYVNIYKNLQYNMYYTN